MMNTVGSVACRAAVTWDDHLGWSVEEVLVDGPRWGEVLVRVDAAGLCHTDETLARGGYSEVTRPVVGGHEGAGVVMEVGPGVTHVAPGDRVVLCVPVPACGYCIACMQGRSHLCERGALTGAGRQIGDGTSRHHARGRDLGIFVFLGTFAEYTVVAEASCLPYEADLVARDVCTVACAGVTGWGSVQNTAQLRPGEIAVVAGVGGVGANAIMAARHLGAGQILAVDPLEPKRRRAGGFGADEAVAGLEEAREVVGSWTQGRMADVVIMAMGTGDGTLLADALALVGKGGRVIIVNVHSSEESSATVSLRDLQSYEKQVRGCLSGSWHGRTGARFLLDLHRRGHYDPSLIAGDSWALEQIGEGYAAQRDGRAIRSLLDPTIPGPVAANDHH